MTMPEQTFQLVGVKGRVRPVLTEQDELGAGKAFDFRRQQDEFTLESDAAPVDHKSFTAASIVG